MKRIHPITERVKDLCKNNGTNITALCVEVTGNSGNLSTWNKGNIRNDYLIKISEKFNISTDWILKGETDCSNPALHLITNGKENYKMNEKARESLKSLNEMFEWINSVQGFFGTHEERLLAWRTAMDGLQALGITRQMFQQWLENDFVTNEPQTEQLRSLLEFYEKHGKFAPSSLEFSRAINDYDYYMNITSIQKEPRISREAIRKATDIDSAKPNPDSEDPDKD